MNLDALLEPVPGRYTQPCKVGRIVAKLEDPYKTALITMLASAYVDGGFSDTMIRTRLTSAGFQVSTPVIWRHRNNQCSCESVVNG